MKYLIISAFITLSFCQLASSQCTFPAALQATWESPAKGNVTFNSTVLTGYDIDTYTGLEFECHNMSGSKYILRSGDFDVLGNSVNAAMCLKLVEESSSKYTYFILTSELADVNYERVMFIQASSTVSSISTICDETSVANNPQETKLLIKYGYANDETVRCPDDILGKYQDYNDTCSNATYWDVCSDLKQMSFDHSNCPTDQAFSENGTVNCVYTVESGSEQVVYVYNTDDTVDESTNYRFTCMVLEKAANKRVYLTQYPQECHSNQTSTYVLSPGTTVELEAEKTCVPSASSDAVSNAGLVAGMAILVIVIVAAVGAVVGYYIYTKKFKKVDPNEKRIIDKDSADLNDQHRVTDAVTPSVVQADLKSPKTSGSHGKISQVLGPEYTMTNACDDAKTGVEDEDDPQTSRKLPAIVTGSTPRDALTSPLDTQLQRPQLPPIP